MVGFFACAKGVWLEGEEWSDKSIAFRLRSRGAVIPESCASPRPHGETRQPCQKNVEPPGGNPCDNDGTNGGYSQKTNSSTAGLSVHKAIEKTDGGAGRESADSGKARRQRRQIGMTNKTAGQLRRQEGDHQMLVPGSELEVTPGLRRSRVYRLGVNT